MKRILTVATLSLAAVPWSQADLTLEQQMEAGAQSGQIVMRVKGGKFRLDLPGGPSGPVSTIVDIKSGDTLTLVHGKKIAISRTGAQLRQAQTAKVKPAGAQKADAPKPEATTFKERIGGFEAEIYTLKVDDSTETLWVVKDYPDFASIREELARVGKASAAGINRAATLDLTTLPGMVVQRHKERGGQKMTITLTGVSRTTIDDSSFAAPADYKAVAPPETPAAN